MRTGLGSRGSFERGLDRAGLAVHLLDALDGEVARREAALASREPLDAGQRVARLGDAGAELGGIAHEATEACVRRDADRGVLARRERAIGRGEIVDRPRAGLEIEVELEEPRLV